MNAPSAKSLSGVGAAVLVALAVASTGPLQVAAALSLFCVVAGMVSVAFAAQMRQSRDEQRLVYRPVYARRQSVQRRVTSDD